MFIFCSQLYLLDNNQQITIICCDSAFCKSSLNHLQLPYLRATHKFDFFLLFLTIWMDILTLICACGALTRTLSVCLDSMTGGMARIYILGRNAPENEPWPDVIGFSIIFIVSVMFMLGLEVIMSFSIDRHSNVAKKSFFSSIYRHTFLISHMFTAEFQSVFMHSCGKRLRYNWHTDCDSIDSRQFNDMAIKTMASKGTARCKLNSIYNITMRSLYLLMYFSLIFLPINYETASW